MSNIKNSFLDYVTHSISGYRDCGMRGCDEVSPCKCYTIDDVEISAIDIPGISDQIIKNLIGSNKIFKERRSKIFNLLNSSPMEVIDRYCVNRILTINKIWDPINWSFSTMDGYYGQELKDIHIDNPNLIFRDINEIFNLNLLEDKINYVLVKEYGYLHECLYGKKYEILHVDKSDIIFGQRDHYSDVLSKDLSYYLNYPDDIPCGVVMKSDDGLYHVIDGYHRISSRRSKRVKVFSTILGDH